jgi:hypothetical protein
MEKRRMDRWAFGAAFWTLFLPLTGIASQVAVPVAPHPNWNEVVHLLSSPRRPIDASTIERSLGVTLVYRTRATDDYDAWIPGPEANSGASLTLNYRPSHYKGYAGSHDSIVHIFVRDFECVSPARMSDDLLHAGFTSASTRAPSTTLEFYMYGEHRSLRVT